MSHILLEQILDTGRGSLTALVPQMLLWLRNAEAAVSPLPCLQWCTLQLVLGADAAILTRLCNPGARRMRALALAQLLPLLQSGLAGLIGSTAFHGHFWSVEPNSGQALTFWEDSD